MIAAFFLVSRGMAGSVVSRALTRQGCTNQLLPNRQNLDLFNRCNVERLMQKNRPEIVVLAAAKAGVIQANND